MFDNFGQQVAEGVVEMKMIHIPHVFVRAILLLSISLVISACANVPANIQSENVAELDAQTVRGQMDRYKGQTVRWGGVITQVINNADDTWIEILALKLNRSGRPQGERKTNQGRFIAKIDQFLDPEVYKPGLGLTVIGILTEEIDGKIGDYNYAFPVVTVQGFHLWSKRTYRHHRHIMPGYWYYGFHPFWRFGYGYYGFGVRLYDDYYPYYPVYGHLDRRIKPLSKPSRPGIYTPRLRDEGFWERRFEGFPLADEIYIKPGSRLYSSVKPGTYGASKPGSSRATKPARQTSKARSSSTSKQQSSPRPAPRKNNVKRQIK